MNNNNKIEKIKCEDCGKDAPKYWRWYDDETRHPIISPYLCAPCDWERQKEAKRLFEERRGENITIRKRVMEEKNTMNNNNNKIEQADTFRCKDELIERLEAAHRGRNARGLKRAIEIVEELERDEIAKELEWLKVSEERRRAGYIAIRKRVMEEKNDQ